MPRYFFHTQIDGTAVPDMVGTELRDPDHAWRAAHAMISALLKQGDGNRNLLAASLVVVDETGETVFELPFSEALISRSGDDEPGDGEPPILH